MRILRGAVVQLVRIPACHAGGRGFESRPLRHYSKKAQSLQVAPFFMYIFKHKNNNKRIIVFHLKLEEKFKLCCNQFVITLRVF